MNALDRAAAAALLATSNLEPVIKAAFRNATPEQIARIISENRFSRGASVVLPPERTPTYGRVGRMTADERTRLANLRNSPARMMAVAERADVLRATLRGTTLVMPMGVPNPQQAAKRVQELRAELEALRTEDI